jgi:hypothetical protein
MEQVLKDEYQKHLSAICVAKKDNAILARFDQSTRYV